MNQLVQFLGYVTKVFALGRLARSVRCQRPYPRIPTRCLFLSLLLGVILRAGSYLALSQQTKRRRWQHLIHWGQRISDDAFVYISERFYLEDLRQSLAEVNKTLKANKALESCKINGLLFLSLDANEHFQSRSRCCPCCCQREVEETDAHGQKPAWQGEDPARQRQVTLWEVKDLNFSQSYGGQVRAVHSQECWVEKKVGVPKR